MPLDRCAQLIDVSNDCFREFLYESVLALPAGSEDSHGHPPRKAGNGR